nr:hypothetical protein [Tanacetum cinerariifolium]
MKSGPEMDMKIPDPSMNDHGGDRHLLSHSDDSLHDYETFCFVIEEKSSDSTTFHSDHSLSDYEAFCFDTDHQEEKSSGICYEEKSSGSTTSHSDLSLFEYESFHFDLSIDPLPPADMSDCHLEEFFDELAHIISPPEEVERFDPFFSLTQSGEKTRVMETLSFGFHHMPSPRPAAYLPKEVMY